MERIFKTTLFLENVEVEKSANGAYITFDSRELTDAENAMLESLFGPLVGEAWHLLNKNALLEHMRK